MRLGLVQQVWSTKLDRYLSDEQVEWVDMIITEFPSDDEINDSTIAALGHLMDVEEFSPPDPLTVIEEYATMTTVQPDGPEEP